MKTFEKLYDKRLKLDGVIYKPYDIGNLPPLFGFISNDIGENGQIGISKWYNYKGLTYIKV